MKLPSYLRSRRRPDLDTPTTIGFEFVADGWAISWAVDR